ncbi:FDX-ACB and Thioredoxin and Evr1 Alr and tRNA-syn t 2d and Methyltransf 11 domain containing protein [Trichuris trichiura]|uniref:Sulfhydryl oxidase n=1 Tax=Trichuris trichiura TaxID=36087 RepID=A0A077YX42_TRITR|nr:FDX-ACB and Thioredoxin and Evr1 Alr and tRNA-syn t 2d and Methyltransf 11 domain containing protein [Trichuris trichiura]
MTIGVLLLFSLTLIAASVSPVSGQEKSVNLYAHAKSVLSLNASTFDDAVFRKNVATIVMLYSSSCGACVGYAPKWVNFAENVKGIRALAYYGYQSKGPNDGATVMEMTHSNAYLLPLVLAKHMMNDWNKLKPADWPNFDLVPTFEMVPQFLSPWAPFMAIIVQTPDDSTGAAITLDLSNQYSVETRIMDYLHPENADPNTIFVHASDVKSGLAYMLRYEVPMRQKIDGEAKVALHQFLKMLTKYLMMERNLMLMLNEFAAFTDESPGSISSEDWRRKYDELQRTFRYPLPNDTTWVGCKGSESRYRGYPCSVWMIFHLLTVQAYINDGHLSNFDPVQVPWSIYGYVKHFFGCRFCANNFGKNAQKMASVIHNKTDGVLWLWKSHNRASYFLKGHVTEDPDFPKNQFPYKEICSNCFNPDGTYNEAMVFRFLLRFYSDVKTFEPKVPDVDHFVNPTRSGSDRKDLFGSEDDVVVINQENFDQTVYGKSNIWFVLYYSSYCGHCVNFAPTWQEVASSVAEWSTVVRVAALNCALDENFAKCQEHSIEGYPMLKSNDASAGKEISLSQRTVNSLISVLAYEAGVYYRQHHPEGWPDLGYIADNETAMSLLKKNKPARYVVILFQVPDDKAALGEQLVLRYANFSETLLVRLARPEHVKVQTGNLAIPALIIADRRDTKTLYTSKHPVNLITATEAIRVNCLIGPTDSKRRNVTSTKLHNFVAPKEELRSEDLQSALSYLLQHEVPIRETIYGKKFVVIKNFIELLNQYYPSDNRNVRLALASLLSWLQRRTGGVSSKDWLEQIKNMKQLYSFPTTVQWVTCRGSDIQYRGYPCGLWMLFHTITVRAFQRDGHKEGFDAKSILNAINGYVQEFFGCRECAKNFGKAAVKIDTEVTQPHDVVIWLWKSHNRANNFLKGTALFNWFQRAHERSVFVVGTLTDDPSHPKAQFPTEKLCPECRTVDGEWDIQEVLSFLTTFYGQKRLREDDSINPKFKPVLSNDDLLAKSKKSTTTNWFSKHPFSVCFFVWIVCSSGATVLFFLLRFLRSRFFMKSVLGYRNLSHLTVVIGRALAKAARMKVGCIGGRIFRRLTAQANALTTEQTVFVNEKSYVRDSWTNLPRSIFNLFGRDLLHASDSPLRLVKLRIVDYFNEKFKNSSRNPLFPLFDFFDPVVSIRQNFDSLLVPPDHVCRLPSDTYYVNKDNVLRTHTSAHQSELINSGLNSFIVAGDVYRRDDIDRNHYPCFHQMEGVHLFTDFTLFGSEKFRGKGPFPQLFHNGDRCPSRQNSHTPACAEAVERHLKSTLEGLMRHLFADEGKVVICIFSLLILVRLGLQLRWTSSYFPFTHPSWELEIFHDQNWMEMLGCGIMEQQILENGFQVMSSIIVGQFWLFLAGAGDRVGWAFGLGLERLAMRLFDIPDIRLFWTKDTGFTSQFKVEDHRIPIVYKGISRYPQCINDIAFWLPNNGQFVKNDFYDLVRAVGGDIVEQVNLIDEYVQPKSGRKSNCFRIVYRHMERTLTQNEANQIHKAIEDAARDQFGVVIRMSTLLKAKAGRLLHILSMTTLPSTYSVFDRDLKRRQRDWAASQHDFKDYEYLRKEVGYRLSDRIYDVKRIFNVAVDLGCGCGYIAPNIYKEHVDTLIQLDMSRVMVERSASSEEVFTARLHADEELVPFRDNSVDLVLSSLSLHWINDLPGTFKRIFNVLRPDGLFLAATFGGNTLYELRSSLQLAETERLGGLAPHLSPLLRADDVTALLNQSGFKLLTVDVDTIVVNYPDIFALLYDLRGMAESSATWLRAESLRRDVLYATSAIYKEMYAKDDCYPATFQIFYLAGWKPAPDTPKAAQRGTANVSLKDLGKLFDK